jgi:hypothetical protein
MVGQKTCGQAEALATQGIRDSAGLAGHDGLVDELRIHTGADRATRNLVRSCAGAGTSTAIHGAHRRISASTSGRIWPPRPVVDVAEAFPRPHRRKFSSGLCFPAAPACRSEWCSSPLGGVSGLATR